MFRILPNLGLKPAVEECAERRDNRLKDQSKCCQVWPYCRCINSLCRSEFSAACKGELTITCGKQLVNKCEDYDGGNQYSKKCSGLSWDVLLDDNWVVPTNPSWDDTSSDDGGDDGTGRAVEAEKLSFIIIGGVVAFIFFFFLLCMAFYCWSVGSKKKKSSQQRSAGQQHKVKTKAAKKKIGRKGASGACAGAGGGETSADLADAKSRSKVRHSSTPRTAARPGGGGSDTEKNLKDTKLQGRSKGASKAAQGMSSFNSRQVNTVDLKTTGANARVAIRYTKFRNALA